jgi:hypothetical protein
MAAWPGNGHYDVSIDFRYKTSGRTEVPPPLYPLIDMIYSI